MDADALPVRPATPADAPAVLALATELAQSFTLDPAAFALSYPALLADPHACVLVADGPAGAVGYLLGLRHLTFFANGPVGWVEEILVHPGHRGTGTGRALMRAFEDWATGHGCAQVGLATRRATPFYRALGYQESATYLRLRLAPPNPS